MNIAVISLGCPKNQVDADRFCRALIAGGHKTVPSPELADAVIINTCAFIQSAKEEAIETILEVCALKQQNPLLRVLVCGCLAERYQDEVAAEIPELDAVVGIGANVRLPEILNALRPAGPSGLAGPSGPAGPLTFFGPKTALPLYGPRVISTPRHYAWLKIADGCSNRCSYCAIPDIRGPLRSCPIEHVTQEAGWLAAQGVRELVLVAQDVTAYGDDTGQNLLVPLLRRLEQIDGIVWIRLLYTYPQRITPELLCAMAESKKILPYLDLPIQHCSGKILRSMGRRGGAAAVNKAIALIREKLPGAVLRTSLIAGYPGESEADFEELCAFVIKTGFDRLGCFAYSPEEGTRAEKMRAQLPEQERIRRADIVMQTQAAVMAKKQEEMAGQTVTVICDGLEPEAGAFFCRGIADAPEIDAGIWVDAGAPMQSGEFYRVLVTAAEGADLAAEYCEALPGGNSLEPAE